MRTHHLAVIGGDGIGPDVIAAALAGIRAAGRRYGFAVETTDVDLGAETWLRTGVALDDDTLARLRGHDAILYGAVGDPRVPPGVLERGVIIALRQALRQAVNVRPIRLYPGVTSPMRTASADNCDLVVVRENTEGLYTGGGSTSHAGTSRAVAIQNSVTTDAATRRTVEYAFRLAAARGNRLTLCHKKNVLVHAGGLWQDVVDETAVRYPGVEHDYVHADAMCQYLPLDPGRFDVVVTDNLFGDIVGDLGSTLQGGLGLAASANIDPTGEHPGTYEPTHGSAPDIAGTGRANPAAACLSAAMCLAGLGEHEGALALEAATAQVLAGMRTLAGPGMGGDTAEIGGRIAERVADVDPAAVGDPARSLMSALAALAQHPYEKYEGRR